MRNLRTSVVKRQSSFWQ